MNEETDEEGFNGDAYRGWSAMTESDAAAMGVFSEAGLNQIGENWRNYKESGYRGWSSEASAMGYYGVRSGSATAFGQKGFNSEFNQALLELSQTCEEASAKLISALRVSHQAGEQRLLKIIDELNLALEEKNSSEEFSESKSVPEVIFSDETSAFIPNYVWGIIGLLGLTACGFGLYSLVLRKKAYEILEAKIEKEVTHPRQSVFVDPYETEFSVSVDLEVEIESDVEVAYESVENNL